MSPEKFRRLTGVKRHAFEDIVKLLDGSRAAKRAPVWRRPKRSVEEILLMALDYLREYRTYFHISKSYGVSEGYAYKLIDWVEDTLIKSKGFSLPGHKALLKSEVEYEVMLIDASETPIQRWQIKNIGCKHKMPRQLLKISQRYFFNKYGPVVNRN